MSSPVPAKPKIYHIVHVDRLSSIIDEGFLLCDAEVLRRTNVGSSMGTTIGMNDIKNRRLTQLTLNSHPGLFVGQCVPFYFCPRSVMLYVIYRANHPNLAYKGGQGPIVHLEADLKDTVSWAQEQGLRWAFTLSNAGSRYFEDRGDLSQLSDINWTAVAATSWRNCQENKQAEFLLERRFPWSLVHRVGVQSQRYYTQARRLLANQNHRPKVEVRPNWYY